MKEGLEIELLNNRDLNPGHMILQLQPSTFHQCDILVHYF